MIEICPSEQCTGCTACSVACGKSAISMQPDAEGFIRPIIDANLCVECGRCATVCPVNNSVVKSEPKQIFSGWSRDKAIRLQSTSGGAFSEIARLVLSDGGAVCGATYDAELNVRHTTVETWEDMDRLRRSKYVQSDASEGMRQTLALLRAGRKVLFSGTPCQVAAMRSLAGAKGENLVTAEVLCHGVPSPMVYRDYLTYIEHEKNFKINSINFRDKRFSWSHFNLSTTGCSGETQEKRENIGHYSSDPFLRGFLTELFLRPSCHTCRYCTSGRVADFTIADWWGYKPRGLRDSGYAYKGVSLLLANTERAVAMLPKMKMSLRPQTLQEAKGTNPVLSRPFEASERREAFWERYRASGFSAELVAEFLGAKRVSVCDRVLERVRNWDLVVVAVKVVGKIVGFGKSIIRRK